MDEILFFGGIAIAVLLGPWVLLWRSHRKRTRQREEDQARWGSLTARIFALEEVVQKFKERPPVSIPSSPVQPTVEEPASAPTALHTPLVPETDLSPEEASKPWVKTQTPIVPPPPPTVPPRPSVAPPVPTFHAAASGPSFAERFKSSLNIEEALGTNWLNKLGVSLLVLGIAFFLAYQLKTLGPAGKVLVGYVVSAVMLGAGIWFERNNRYRILARAGVGGGWALLFFVTYAMYHVPAAHVLSSQPLDLVLMLVVAAAMVWHTLRYRSQVVTGLSFFLAFLTVTVSHSSVYSLSAGAVLALALVVIVGRMQWFELEVFGIVGSYLNHYLWLRPIIEPMHGKRHPFPEFAASAGILTLYWVIFRVSYVWRKPASERQEHISTIAALLNTILLLLLFKYQSTHPEWAFWALLAIGGMEALLGQLPITRRRRTAVIVLSTLGVILLVAAFPFRYSGSQLSVLWLLESEALLLIGVWTREVVFRRLGLLASVVVAGQMTAVNAARVCGMRMDGADVRPDYRLALIFGIAAVLLFANSHWVTARWRERFAEEIDRRIARWLSQLGTLMAFLGLWIAFPEAWTVVAWVALGLGLVIAAQRFGIRTLAYEGHVVAVAVLIRILAINLETSVLVRGISLRLVTVGCAAVLLYLSARWSGWAPGAATSSTYFSNWPLVIHDAYTWVASFLLALLVWYELRPVGVAVAWAVGGLLLLEIGLTRRSTALRLQAYVAFLAAFARIFFVNLNASGFPGEVSPRFYTVIPIALAFFYAYWRLNHDLDQATKLETKLHTASVCSYLGTISVASLMRFELEADWVAAAWAALAFVLLAIAWRSGRRIFLHQSLLIVFGVLFRTTLHNFYERSYFPAPLWQSRLICAGAAIALLFAALPIAMKVREKDGGKNGRWLRRVLSAIGRRPELIFFFTAVILLTVLLALEMRHGMVTLSWGIEGVAVFLLALRLGERSFRLTGLGLLLLCAGKILLVDVWGLNPRDRYLTFIVLGAALLLVSFLYTKNREALRQYL
ncbi:MAG TPA: DUF2339 domain-containing protein [Terriglobales bacterium]|nr:DUF2339 domain-containing protein [Terriglobales bacterium]